MKAARKPQTVESACLSIVSFKTWRAAASLTIKEIGRENDIAKLTKIEDTAPATPWNFSGCEEDKKIAAMVKVKSMPSVPQIMEGNTSDQYVNGMGPTAKTSGAPLQAKPDRMSNSLIGTM